MTFYILCTLQAPSTALFWPAAQGKVGFEFPPMPPHISEDFGEMLKAGLKYDPAKRV